jgi:hypothetical protein
MWITTRAPSGWRRDLITSALPTLTQPTAEQPSEERHQATGQQVAEREGAADQQADCDGNRR